MNGQPPHANGFAIKTYRYLRIAMVGIVVLLGISIGLEKSKVDCFQTSISAYYYTPVRALFVGGLLAIGVSLIVIKGSTAWEDVFLNIAGMLAPLVAVVPTSGTGNCWSIPPSPLPRNEDGTMADWVLANIENNVRALIYAGFAGLVAAAIIAAVVKRDAFAPFKIEGLAIRVGWLAAFAILLVGLGLHLWWDPFPTRSHGFAAVLMFVFLALAIGTNAWERRRRTDKRIYFRIYAAIAGLMVLVGVVMLPIQGQWRHTVLVLEAIEILLFAAFWSVQTREHWYETAGPVAPTDPEAPTPGS